LAAFTLLLRHRRGLEAAACNLGRRMLSLGRGGGGGAREGRYSGGELRAAGRRTEPKETSGGERRRGRRAVAEAAEPGRRTGMGMRGRKSSPTGFLKKETFLRVSL